MARHPQALGLSRTSPALQGGEDRDLFHDHALWSKSTQVEPSINAPGDIGFNALWDRAFVPAIQDSATNPLRVDQDTGALTLQAICAGPRIERWGPKMRTAIVDSLKQPNLGSAVQ